MELCPAATQEDRMEDYEEKTPDERLSEIVGEIGEEAGFAATAEFAPFRDLTVKWARTNRTIHLRISDYLDTAPEDALRSIIRYVFDRIDRRKAKCGSVYRWITTEEFRREKRDAYLGRNGFTGTEGIHRDLRKNFESLKEMGLISDEDGVMFTWTEQQALTSCGLSSPVFKVAAVSDTLDRESVPDEVLDWILYYHWCHAAAGFVGESKEGEKAVAEARNRFPNRKRCQDWIDSWIARECPPAVNTPVHGPPVTAVSKH